MTSAYGPRHDRDEHASESVGTAARPALRVAVAATFTADPLEPPLRFWLDQLGYAGEIELAPYNQVFQALLDPSSALGRNAGGINLVLVRFEDFERFAERASQVGDDLHGAQMSAHLDELLSTLQTYSQHVQSSTLVWVGPASDAAESDPVRRELFQQLERELAERLRGLPGVQLLSAEALGPYHVEASYDARRDAIGHIPYTPAFFTALATACARRIHAIKTPAIKVIALDCDNTLWKGVVGEDGYEGLELTAGHLALQDALIAQQAQGVVLCLLSKNAEEDVLEVFERRADMRLQREHLVGHRVNWSSKAQNIAELAAELNVGLDSFLFIDDNPVECAQMRAAHPQVQTLQLPSDQGDEIQAFLQHIWAFDRLTTTEEDRRRTRMYQENAKRASLEREAGSIRDFLAGLALEIDIAAPQVEELPRVAQLTARTNQFNFTTLRRSEAQVAQLGDGLECLRVTVRDRFGDYGLVGVMIFGTHGDQLRIDTMLLSCRVLGRGVEHAMLSELGKLALARGLHEVAAPFSQTKKNRPALDFLESLAAHSAQSERSGEDVLYRIPAQRAAELRYQPGADAASQLELARTGGKVAESTESAAAQGRSEILQRIASELRSIEQVHAAVAASAMTTRPELEVPWIAPRSALERELAQLWEQLLHLDRVGAHDDFASLGGTSLMAAQLFVEIEERYGVKLPMTTILDAPTIEALAKRVSEREGDSARSSLRGLRKGAPQGPNLFLVHDGDGETLLYMNLARRLPASVNVFGIEPMGNSIAPMRHTRIPDMATHYVDLIMREQPSGPYLLGGMCAGGTIAFEMALQLEARGQSVQFVALLDSADAQAKRKLGLHTKRRLSRFVRALRSSEPPPPPVSTAPSPVNCGVPTDGRPSRPPPAPMEPARAANHEAVGPRLQRATLKLNNLIRYEARTRLDSVGDRARFLLLRQALDRGLGVPGWLRHMSVRTIYDLAEREYVPAKVLDAQALLFRATSGQGTDEAFIRLYEDPLFGWRRRVRRGLEVHDVPGGHSSMLQEQFVDAIASRMRPHLDVEE